MTGNVNIFKISNSRESIYNFKFSESHEKMDKFKAVKLKEAATIRNRNVNS